MPVRARPDISPDSLWAIEMFEQQMENTLRRRRSSGRRGTQLRSQTAATDIEGCRQAWLALAERYEAAAAAGLAQS